MKCFWHEAGYESELREATNIDQYRREVCDASTAGTGGVTGTTIAGSSGNYILYFMAWR